ncbi:SCO family protein [Rugamonas sp. A1-17]|nr:SCO family protein [Rugamonas sp. A1-17]
MNYLASLRRAALAAALLLPMYAWSAAALPGNSVYRLDATLTDAAGQHFALHDMAGTPVLITMFYGDCHAACPVIIETLKRTVAALGPDGKRVRVLMISLDPKHDTPAALSSLLMMHQLDPAQFRLVAAGSDSQTRALAATLNIKYRVLESGEINHTTRIALLDASGTVQVDTTRLDADPDPAFVKQVAALIK